MGIPVILLNGLFMGKLALQLAGGETKAGLPPDKMDAYTRCRSEFVKPS